MTAILCILNRANVALGYTLCRYDGSGGEERASTKTSGSCGIHKLGMVVSTESRSHCVHIPADIKQIMSHLGLKLFEVVHYHDELDALYPQVLSDTWACGEYSLPCSVALYVCQAFSSSMSYAAKDVVAFRLVIPNVNS